MLVWHVDDDPDLSILYDALFSGYLGSEFQAFTSGQEVLAELRLRLEQGQKFPDLIVMDYQLANPNVQKELAFGTEVIREIRALLYPVASKPVIVGCSSDLRPEVKNSMLAAGADHYVDKVNFSSMNKEKFITFINSITEPRKAPIAS